MSCVQHIDEVARYVYFRPIDFDTVLAGAILADVGKLLEYELGPDGNKL